ncbi:hypothetical protein [Streptomyces sp. CC228A]|uniref:hypothetical protein n=1 Tax=Streptomyces sp. CC228A TaxID=2898186 RepID=UPI001F1830B2|nr:hypothetical protein [Streptomyces sp. CC228A]
MKPVPPAVRAVVSDRGYAPGLPDHPESYAVTEPGEVRAVAAAATAAEREGGFLCMCGQDPVVALYDAGGQCFRTVQVHRAELLEPSHPLSLPGRHRGAWAAAAPQPLREYAGRWARGESAGPGAVPPVPSVPPSSVFDWLGTPLAADCDAARLVARRAPLALLAQTPTEELAWGVRECGAAGLDGAVEFFASESFTSRHPKKRRVGATARDLLLRHARSRRPALLAVLERRVLRAPEDRITR